MIYKFSKLGQSDVVLELWSESISTRMQNYNLQVSTCSNNFYRLG